MDVALDSKYAVKYVREGRICLAFVHVYYFFPCIAEWYQDHVGNDIIDYLVNREDV